MRFDANGQFLGAYSFGWDSTPGIFWGRSSVTLFLMSDAMEGCGIGVSKTLPSMSQFG
jgi:hypothetical protein